MPKKSDRLKLAWKDLSAKIAHRLEHLKSYRVLFFMWLVLGLVTLILGTTTRVSYACVWVLLLLEYLARSMEE